MNSIHQRIIYYANSQIETLYQDFQISENGYNQEQVDKSSAQYGHNIFNEKATDTIGYRLRRAFITPFSIILFILAAISFITDVLLVSNYTRNLTTVVIILSMLLISGLTRFIQEMRSKHIFDHLSRITNSNIYVRRQGVWEEMASSELVVGDRIKLMAGDFVPADIRLTMSHDLFVSQSVITGESAVLEKKADPISQTDIHTLSDYHNILFMGSTITGGIGEGIVLAVGKDTVYGDFSKIKNNKKNRFDQDSHAIAMVLIRFIIILVPIVFLICGMLQGNWLSAFLFALSIAVGLTPEMLPMVINACLAKGSVAMEQKQTVVKNINAMQGFGSMDILCVDKTGTLTGNTVLLEYYLDILGNESQKVLNYAYLNSLYHTGIQNHLDTAILKYQDIPQKHDFFINFAQQHDKLDELPFDYQRKFSSVLVKGEKQNILIVKGHIEKVCQRCRYIEYQDEQMPMGDDCFENVHAIVDEMLESGMKVLAVAYKMMESEVMSPNDENDLILLGYLVFFDAPKKSAKKAIEKLKKLHIDIKVLTGDQKSVAISICRRLDIDTNAIMTGSEFEMLNENDLPVRVEQTNIFAELSPKQKVQILQILQSNGHNVGFLGDGMNDLPAIIEADVGISVDTAVEAVKESADVILLKKDLNVLEAGILEGRKAFANMSKYIRITASSNFGNILAIIVASVTLPFFPMTSVQILLLNLLYDIICLVLPWDNVDDTMYTHPLNWSVKTLGRFMRFFGPISSLFDIITFLFLFFILCPRLCGGPFNALTIEGQTKFIALFQTGWFLESMWTQVLILHSLRTQKIPLIQSKPSFPVMFVTTLGIIILTILIFTPLGHLIGLTALPLLYFGFLIIAVILYFIIVTIAKKRYIKKYHELL